MGQLALNGIVEIGAAYLYLVLGISLALNPKFWLELVPSLRNNSPAMLGFGVWALSFGLIVVLAHNDWSWSPSVIITILGWSALLKYIIYFFCPESLWNLYDRFKSFYTVNFMRGYGIVAIVLMLWVIASYRGIL